MDYVCDVTKASFTLRVAEKNIAEHDSIQMQP